jgi:hypothetical protein
MRVICGAVIWPSVLLASAHAESVDVKYRGSVDLTPFACTDTVSSFVNRMCYDKANQYMLILLKKTWYHYCEIDKSTVDGLLEAESKGRYYNGMVKGNFDCRTHRVPTY